jgi:hypothetical protein
VIIGPCTVFGSIRVCKRRMFTLGQQDVHVFLRLYLDMVVAPTDLGTSSYLDMATISLSTLACRYNLENFEAM